MKILGNQDNNADIIDKEYVDKALEYVKITIPKIWCGSESEYVALNNNIDPNTLYIIEEN